MEEAQQRGAAAGQGEWHGVAAEGGGGGGAAEASALAATWWDLSAFLKQQCGGSTAFLLSGSPEASKGLRMKADRRYPLLLGGVDCRLLQYSIRGMPPVAPPAAAAEGAAADPTAG